MGHKLGGYWTAIERKDGMGWMLRDHHLTIDDAAEYAEKMDMHEKGRVVILREVAELKYTIVLADA